MAANDLKDFLDRLEPTLPEHIKAKGWVYKDFPRMPEQIYDLMILELGENVEILTHAVTTVDGKKYARGQVFMCPKAIGRFHDSIEDDGKHYNYVTKVFEAYNE